MNARRFRLLFWLGFIAAVIVGFTLLQGILMPFAVSLVLAYLLEPLVDRLERWRIVRGLASLAVLLVFLLAIAVVLLLLVPLVQQQVTAMIARMPSLVAAIQDEFGRLMETLQRHVPATEVAKLRELVNDQIGHALAWAGQLLQGMITSSFAVLNIVSLIVVTPVVTFFLLRDWYLMVAQIDALVPRPQVATVREQARIIADTLDGFVHGQAVVCLILAVYYASALSLAGIDSGLVVGLLIGVLAIVPVAGAAIGLVLSLVLAALQYGTWAKVLVVLGIFAFGQSVEANILTPKLVGDRIHLHPVWVIFSLLAGGELFGIAGVLVSVPAAAAIGVLVRFAIGRYRQSPLYDPQPVEPPRRIFPLE
jgi:predicted PurR-regulated permease PerM